MKELSKIWIYGLLFALAALPSCSEKPDPDSAKAPAPALRDVRLDQFALGEKYHRGEGVETNDAKAVEYFRSAAESGLPDAQFQLGVMIENGWGVKADSAAAINWYRQAAELGHASARYQLGLRFANGQGVNKNETEAAKWFLSAAEAGDMAAQYNIGARYAAGLGVKNDFGEAARWTRKAAMQGDAGAQFSLARFYADGHVVPPEGETAATWFRKAAEQNHATAQYCLGYRLVHGEGIAANDTEGAQWLRKAAEHGDASAQYELGNCCVNGSGVITNRAEALKWTLVAAGQGIESAARAQAELEHDINPADLELARQQAQELLSRFKPGATIPASKIPVGPTKPPEATNAASAVEATDAQKEIIRLETEVKKSPTNYAAMLSLTSAYLQLRQTNRATELLDHLVQNAATDTNALFAATEGFGWMNDLPRLETTYEKLAKILPKDPDIWYDLAATRAALGKEPEWLAALKSALALNKKRLAKDAQAHDLLAAARTDKRFNSVRDSIAFKKLIPAK